MQEKSNTEELVKQIQVNNKVIQELQRAVELQGKKIVELEKKCSKYDNIIEKRLGDAQDKLSQVMSLFGELRDELEIEEEVEADSKRDE